MALPVHKWIMVVDLDKCTGCGACVVACHAENNVPIQTETEIVRRRAMHWIHIERYWIGQYPTAMTRFIPLLCQQCERAPCEPVCPVYATLHDERESLNLQVYNRCVGTRYCQNNDPYKVRFFNFFDPSFPEPLDQQLNPDVTVRTAGVMEKCTFCVQRIRRAEERALIDQRELADGEVVPACVQTCPPSALLFGDMNNPNSAVNKLLANNERAFQLLDHLGTVPSVYYLKGGKSRVGDG
jgi:Fe-S-cluster-containing dehydrogenase component